LLDVRARHFPLELLLDTRRRRVAEVRRGYGGDGIARVAPLDSSRDAGHDHRLEIENVRLKGDVRPALRGRYGKFAPFEPDAPHYQRHVPVGSGE